MLYFTADWHLGEDRIGINGKPDLFYRPFTSVAEQHAAIVKGIEASGFKNGDSLWHLGDVLVQDQYDALEVLQHLRSTYPDSSFRLIRGNYDVDEVVQKMAFIFDEVHDEYTLDHFEAGRVYLNHYPVQCLAGLKEARLGITGHIHSLWKVQPGLINVGVDAWHFRPVSEDTIRFCWNAMDHVYDENVFTSLFRRPSVS